MAVHHVAVQIDFCGINEAMMLRLGLEPHGQAIQISSIGSQGVLAQPVFQPDSIEKSIQIAGSLDVSLACTTHPPTLLLGSNAARGIPADRFCVYQASNPRRSERPRTSLPEIGGTLD